MKNKQLVIFASLIISILLIGNSNAGPLQPSGERIFDPSLRINLAKDANLANTLGFPQQYGNGGFMVQNDARRFIQSLNENAYLGLTNWRLPTMSELMHLYHNDGIAWIYNNPERSRPFDNLGTYYWTNGGDSFSFISGQPVSFAAYRYVLPVASLRYRYIRPQDIRPKFDSSNLPYQPLPFYRP